MSSLQFRLILIASAVLASSLPAATAADPSTRGSSNLRLLTLNGSMRFDSTSAMAGSSFSSSGHQAGSRLEVEHGGRTLGYLVDVQVLYIGRIQQVAGSPLFTLSLGASLAWKLTGNGKRRLGKPEATLYTGAALEAVPLVNLSEDPGTGALSYDLDQPVTAGPKIGLRISVPLFADWLRLEVSGFAVRPVFALVGTSGGSLEIPKTSALGVNGLVDLGLTRTLSVGVGYWWNYSQMSFLAPGSSSANQTTVYSQLFGARLNFKF